MDKRILKTVRTGKTTAKPDAHAGEEAAATRYSAESVAELRRMISLGIITNPSQVGGYPDYTGQPFTDLGSDGIRASWKKKFHLDLHDADLAQKDLQGDGYTVLEKYLYALDPRKKVELP